MSDHLPECPHSNSRTVTFYGGYCVCSSLRACEQRVREEIDREAFVLDDGDPFRQAYRKGLDAAREAVAETQRWHEFSWGMDDDEDGEYVKTEEALAAIDALRGDP